jgi:hypothetical protein
MYDEVGQEEGELGLVAGGGAQPRGIMANLRRRTNLIMGIVIGIVVLFIAVLVVWVIIKWFRDGRGAGGEDALGPGDCPRSLYIIGHNGSFDTTDAQAVLANERELLYPLDRFHVELVPRILPGDPAVFGSNCLALTGYVTNTLTPAALQLDSLVRSALHHDYHDIALPSQSTLLERFLSGRFVYPISCGLPDVLFFTPQPLFSDRYKGARARFLVLDALAPTVTSLPAEFHITRFADVGTTQDSSLVALTLSQLGLVPGNAAYQIIVVSQAGDYDSKQTITSFQLAALAAGYTLGQVGSVELTIGLVDATTFSLADIGAANGAIAPVVAAKTKTVIVVAADNSLWPEVAQQWGTTIFNLDTVKTAVLGLRFAPTTDLAEVSTPVYTGCVPAQRLPSRDTAIILGSSSSVASTFEITIAPFNAYLMEAVKWASHCYADRATNEHVEKSVFDQPLVFNSHEEVAYLLQCGVYLANEKTLATPLANFYLNGRWYGQVAVP